MDQLPFEASNDVLEIAPRYRTLQDEEPIARVRATTGDPAWLVTRHEDVRELFSDARLGRSHPDPASAARASASVLLGGPVGSHDREQADHRRMRKLLAPAFSARRMSALRPRVGSLAEELLDALPGPLADIHQALSVPLPALVICELLGVPSQERHNIREWSTMIASFTTPDESRAALRDLMLYMRSLIAAKRKTPGDDVITDLTIAQQEHDLTDDDLARMAAMLLFAGHETTVTRIDLGIVLLTSQPGQLRVLRGDPGLVPAAVEEVLRLSSHNGVGGLPRYAHDDITINETAIAAGEMILLATGVANRDPRAFDTPDAIDISRSPNPHLAFGYGPRYCIGASLARIELQEVFIRIARRFPDMHLAVPRTQLQLHAERLTGGLTQLPVTW